MGQIDPGRSVSSDNPCKRIRRVLKRSSTADGVKLANGELLDYSEEKLEHDLEAALKARIGHRTVTGNCFFLHGPYSLHSLRPVAIAGDTSPEPGSSRACCGERVSCFTQANMVAIYGGNRVWTRDLYRRRSAPFISVV